jgi:uncharacterized membrane protein YkvI
LRKGQTVQVLRVAATYVGTVVGAGFASGRETLQFFAAYGRWGLAGLALSTAAFIGFGMLVMDLGRRLKAKSHREILDYACGARLGWILDPIITVFLFAALAVMLAGAGAVAEEQLRLPAAFGTWVTLGLTVITILYGMRGVVLANSVVVPLLGLSVLALSLYSLWYHGLSPLGRAVELPALRAGPNWWLSACLYAGYNLVLSLSVLGPLGAEMNDRKVIVRGALLGGLGLGVLGLCIKMAVLAHLPEIATWQVPMLFLTNFHPPWIQLGYALVLWAEIYTTAIGSAFGFSQRVAAATGWGHRWVLLWGCLLALAGSSLGFANMVGTVYPLLGYGSLLILLCLGGSTLWRRPA